MFLSVLLASRNGVRTLPGVLDSLSRATEPRDGFEVIAVDSASSDGTRELLESYKGGLPLTVLSEPLAGKNLALNRALARAQGDLLVFTDDDVVLPKNFLDAYLAVASRESSHALFGGHVVARWSTVPDERILREIPLGTAYAITEPTRPRGPVEANMLYGPNVAARRSVFEAGLRFDESFGPNGGAYLMGSETDFLLRAEALGFSAFFEPSIAVEHRIEEEQLERRWLEGRAFRAGRTMLHNQLRRHGELADVKLLFGFPRWALLRCVRAELRSKSAWLRPSSSGALAALWHGAFLRGYLQEHRRWRREHSA